MDKLQFLVLIELKAAAKCQLNDAQRRRFEGIFKARAKTDRNNYLSRIADEVEEDLHHNNMRSAFRAIETLAGQKHSLPVLSCIHKADGIPCRSNEQVMQRWSENFTAAFNHLSAITTSTLHLLNLNQFLLFRIQTSGLTGDSLGLQLTIDEVIRAIKKLKNGRAAGSDGISPKLLKCAIGPISCALHSIHPSLEIWHRPC